MLSAQKPLTDRRPAPVTDPLGNIEQEIPTGIIDMNPSSLDMNQGMPRRALPPFALIRTPLRPRTSAEILAELSEIGQTPENIPMRPTTPTPYRRSQTPVVKSSPKSVLSVFKTPESNRTATRLRLVKMETSPASSDSKRSVDTEGDMRMRNGAWTSPEVARFHLREEVQAMVMQSVHNNFEFERGRFADEIREQLLTTIGEDVECLVHENFEAALVRALARPEDGETAAVQLVRERLGRMRDEGRVRVFCTPEMLNMLKRLVNLVDLEMRMEAWSLVEADESWIG
ncbi:hypothetical protein CI238_08047 [Colletotrichum incanum]|uniref:Uncharacterized protein n=1 Tax=Colletotrichum incanum TaxID=1573173 RepID=A0A162NKH2_COLIC|nr:hypothetical protein CI238_08047 [Colletotrichum incanum]OHW95744.1 hypothetical protein CSPAE12_05635 [Colletotrichum incanum]